MKRSACLLCCLICVLTWTVSGQSIDLLIKNGHVIDPKNNIDAIMDVAIVDKKIVVFGCNNSQDQVARNFIYRFPVFAERQACAARDLLNTADHHQGSERHRNEPEYQH